MVFISKNDKQVWEEYILNFNQFTFNLDKKNTKISTKKQDKSINRKIQPFKNIHLLKKGKIQPDGIIDLHGYKLENAKIKLKIYIINAFEKNFRNIIIITGKGINNMGVLKREVPIWLQNEEIKRFIISFETAPQHIGGNGALIVRIKNKYKNLY